MFDRKEISYLRWSSVPAGFGKSQGKPTEKARFFFLSSEPLEFLERGGKHSKKNKEFLAEEKKQGNPKKIKEKKIR